MQGKKTSTGLDEHLEGMLCYAGLWVTGLVFLIIETDNKFVRFHAIQSLVAFGLLTIGWAILASIPVVGAYFVSIVGLGIFALWIAMMYRAYLGYTYKLPFAGNIAERYSSGKTG